jgi:hypothetical protein
MADRRRPFFRGFDEEVTMRFRVALVLMVACGVLPAHGQAPHILGN